MPGNALDAFQPDSGLILVLSLWPEFQGHGALPGIKSAGFETRTPEIVGTRIQNDR